MAQAVVVILWALDWHRRGASYPQGRSPLDSLLGSFLIILLFAGLPMVVVGLVDGLAGRRAEGPHRRFLLSALVIRFAALVAVVGIETLDFEDLFGQEGRPPSAGNRINHLICMEVVLLLELGIAAALRRAREQR